jgi:secondary thiamine-phosphate synthase enzyme
LAWSTQADRARPTLQCLAQPLSIRTRGKLELHDISEQVQDFVAGVDIVSGFVLVQSLHTTLGLLLNEYESGLRSDFAGIAEQLIPSEADYVHDDMSVRSENLCPEDLECPNGHSHLQQTTFGTPSLILAVQEGSLVLGQWQRILAVEFDRARDRRVMIQALGIVDPGLERDMDAV